MSKALYLSSGDKAKPRVNKFIVCSLICYSEERGRGNEMKSVIFILIERIIVIS